MIGVNDLLPEDSSASSGWREAVGGAHALLGGFYFKGYHFETDVRKAMDCWLKAARLNSPAAFHILGRWRDRSVFFVFFNWFQGERRAGRALLHLAAQHGVVEARFTSANDYLVRASDTKRARLWLRGARDAGLDWPVVEMFLERLENEIESTAAAASDAEAKPQPAGKGAATAAERKLLLTRPPVPCDETRDTSRLAFEGNLRGFQRHWVPQMDELLAMPRSAMTEFWCAAKQLATDLLSGRAGSSAADTRRRALATVLYEDAWVVLSPAEFVCIYLVAKTCCLDDLDDELSAASDVEVHPEHHAAVFLAPLYQRSVEAQISALQAFQAQYTATHGVASIVVMHRLGQLQALPGANSDPGVGNLGLRTALDMLDELNDPDHVLFEPVLRATYQMSVLFSLIQSTLARKLDLSELVLAETRAKRFVWLGRKHGNRKLAMGHMKVFQTAVTLQREEPLQHYRNALKADNELPDFLRGIWPNVLSFTSVEEVADMLLKLESGEMVSVDLREHAPQGTPVAELEADCRAEAAGGELLCVDGVDPALFGGSDYGLQHMRGEFAAVAKRDDNPPV